jgi:hypothetical protein
MQFSDSMKSKQDILLIQAQFFDLLGSNSQWRKIKKGGILTGIPPPFLT